MKIQHKIEFTPITITIESMDELRCLLASLNVANHCKDGSYGYQHHLHGEIDSEMWSQLKAVWEELN